MRPPLLTLPAPNLGQGELELAMMVDFGQERICDAVDLDPLTGRYRACRRVTIWYRAGRAWALCRYHAYNEVTVDARRRRR